MCSQTRRDLLKSTGGLAALAASGGMSGCLGLFGGGGGTDVNENSPAKAVPNRAGALLHADFAAMLEADELLDSTDTVLAERRDTGTAGPESVTGALSRLEETYGLDPTKMNAATGFIGEDIVSTATATPRESAYWGIVGETAWEGAAMRESFRDAAPNRVSESTYDGNTVLQIGEETLSVLGDGMVVLGSNQAVEDAIDVAAGNGNGVTGELRRAFDSANGAYARFALNLDMVAVGTQLLGAQAVEAVPFSSIQHIYGSLFDDGSDRGLRVIVKVGSATKAEQLAAQIDSFVGIAKAQGVKSGFLRRYEPAIEGLTTESDGKRMTATYSATSTAFNEVAAQLLADFLLGIRKS